jgi:hypothetical protein
VDLIVARLVKRMSEGEGEFEGGGFAAEFGGGEGHMVMDEADEV